MREGKRVQLRASRRCSKEIACNHEQVALARRKLRAIMSNWQLLERSCVQLRATGTCSKENALNQEQVADAHNRLLKKSNRATVGALCERPFFGESTRCGRSTKRKRVSAQPQEIDPPLQRIRRFGWVSVTAGDITGCWTISASQTAATVTRLEFYASP